MVGDHKEHLEIAIDIFKKVESGEYKVEIIEPVIMEAFFVLVKFYKIPKKDVISDLKKIIALQGVVGNKIVLFETLHILEDKNIDFVDALICAKSRLQGYKKLSFDKDVNKKC